MTEYKIGQEILYTYQGRQYADVIDHIPVARTWVSTKWNGHFVDVENIITPPLNISKVARVELTSKERMERNYKESLRTSYEESLTSMVGIYEMNRLHESINAMHKAHAIDLALDAGNVELFNTLTEGASSV